MKRNAVTMWVIPGGNKIMLNKRKRKKKDSPIAWSIHRGVQMRKSRQNQWEQQAADADVGLSLERRNVLKLGRGGCLYQQKHRNVNCSAKWFILWSINFLSIKVQIECGSVSNKDREIVFPDLGSHDPSVAVCHILGDYPGPVGRRDT